MSGITYDLYVTVIWKKSEKNKMGELCFAFEVQRVHFLVIIEIFPFALSLSSALFSFYNE